MILILISDPDQPQHREAKSIWGRLSYSPEFHFWHQADFIVPSWHRPIGCWPILTLMLARSCAKRHHIRQSVPSCGGWGGVAPMREVEDSMCPVNPGSLFVIAVGGTDEV